MVLSRQVLWGLGRMCARVRASVYREARVSCKQVSCRRNHAYQLTPAQPRRPGTGGAVASPAILLILSHPGPVLTSGCSPLCRGPWLCPSACHLQPCACPQRWVRSRGPRPLTEQERGSPSAQQDRGQVAARCSQELSISNRRPWCTAPRLPSHASLNPHADGQTVLIGAQLLEQL